MRWKLHFIHEDFHHFANRSSSWHLIWLASVFLTRADIMLTTPIYTAIFGWVFVALSVRTLLLRRSLGVGLGDGDQPMLARAVRVHSNFAEYVPISLLLIYFLETQVEAGLWIHVLCSALLIGRITHAFGVSQVKENYRYRVIGMALTFTVIISASIGLMIGYALHPDGQIQR
jgi:uncharacterized protein